jgi:YD repeat-containing protein
MFGMNWISTYEERIFVGGDGLVQYSSANGNLWSFGVTTLYAAGGTQTIYSLVAPRNGGASLVTDGTYLTLTFKNGEKRVFNRAAGQLLSISDRNGNTTQLTYDASNRLATVTDAASRHLYLTYTQIGAADLVTGVTSDFGVSVSYSYDGLYLSRVTRADNTFVTFEYNALPGSSNYLITAVKDQDGKVLESHTYDSGNRGLSSQRANGVDALSVTYAQ